jgi:hypothetical protein
MAKRKRDCSSAPINQTQVIHKKRRSAKRKKEAKKEKHAGKWKTLRVSHIPA